MAKRTFIWHFYDAADRDAHGPAQGVTESDIAVLDVDGSLWVFDAGAWKAVGGSGSTPTLADVLAAGNATGGNVIDYDLGGGFEAITDVTARGVEGRAVSSDKIVKVTHTPSGSSLVTLGPPLFVPMRLAQGDHDFGGWMRVSGSVAGIDDINGSVTGDFFLIEGPFGFGGITTPIVMKGKMRQLIPDVTDYGAMRVTFSTSEGIILQLRDWNDSITRSYNIRVELHAYDGQTPV